MKRFFTFLFISCCSFAILQAQVTLTKETHGFVPGQAHKSQQTEYQSPGESGQNIIWDFSNAKISEKVIPSSTDFKRDEISGAMKAYRHDDKVTFLYNISERGNEYLGYEKGSYKLVFSKPLLKTLYPQSFGTFFEGEYEGDLSYGNNSNSYPVSGTYSTHADAAGTIILPNGDSYPALRVHTTQTSSMNGSVSVVEKYLWYTHNVRLPLFVSIQNFGLKEDGSKILKNQQSYFTPDVKIENDITGIDNLNAIAYKVFPNPFQGVIELNYNLPQDTKVTIELFDTKGMKLKTLVSQIQNGSISVTEDVSRYTQNQGTYFLKLQFGDKVYTEKLIRK